MIDLKEFRAKLRTFEPYYMREFDEFWRWKIKTETERKHILDDKYRDQTCSKLWSILRGWQAYRPYNSTACLRVLEDALKKMADAYNQIRSYSLLEFDKIRDEPLKLIWHELGRVKEIGGRKNKYGYYYIVSLSKHLMFLWGQTPAFDSRVRTHIPWSYNVSKDNRWHFGEWKSVLERFQEDLSQEPEVVDSFKKESLKRYGTESMVPYGRFLDVYYH
jgi:hypothetical protein